MKRVLLALALLLPALLPAADAPFEFADAAEEARFQRLLSELRCLVCQNQSLEDSHAALAQDLRNEAYALIRRGASDAQVVEFMVARYGDFVRYRPPIKPLTLALWFGPVLLLGAGATVAWRYLRHQRREPPGDLSPEDAARAARLLAGEAPSGERGGR